MRCVRLRDDVVVELFDERSTLVDKLHPDFLAALADAPDEVQLWWVRQPDGSFTPPPEPEQ